MIAFVFPGQGSQYVGMGQLLADRFDVFREAIEEADAALGEPISRVCFEGPKERLTLTVNTQPALLAVSVATYRLLSSRGIGAGVLAGHSLGEYSANVAAGTISLADGLRIVRRRGQYMQEAVPVGSGSMAAILGLDTEVVTRVCEEVSQEQVVSSANINAPGQVVIAGDREAVDRASERMLSLGAKRVLPLPVSAPFHCSLMEPAKKRLEPELRKLVVSDPAVPIVANVDAKVKTDAESAIDALVRQVSAPVQWESVVRRLESIGVKTFVEVGPGKVLSGLIRKIDRGLKVVNVEDPDGITRLEKLIEINSEEVSQ